MLQESNSRYPVYEENLDHIIGVLYLKDAMRLHTSDESLNRPILSLIHISYKKMHNYTQYHII